jgi:hypothetical protein
MPEPAKAVTGCNSGDCGQQAGTESHGPLARVVQAFHDPCATIPSGAMPSRPGASIRAWNGAMSAHAATDKFVVYNHEWYQGGTTLGPYGQSHLHQLVQRLAECPLPIILQPEGPPELTEGRRLMLVHQLAALGVPAAELRVVVDCASAEGFNGEEAIRIYPRMIQGGQGGSGGVGAPQFGSGGLGGAFSGFGGLGGFGGMGGRGY